MPFYTFYPRRADGCATTWLCAELENDQAALAYAKGALAAHPSAESLIVLEGDRELWFLARDPARLPDDERAFSGSRARIAASLDLLGQTACAGRAGKS